MNAVPIHDTAAPTAWRRFLRRPPSWAILLIATPFLAGFYLMLPEDGIARSICYPAFGLIGTAAILAGIHVRRPDRVVAWRLIAISFALLSLGDVIYMFLDLAREIGYPSLADISYLAGYLCLVLGFGGLVRGSIPGGDRASVIDAAILAAGAGSVFWIFIVQPSVNGVIDPVAGTVSMLYPALDLILLAIGLRVVLTDAASPRYLKILLAGILVYFVADVVYAQMVTGGTYGLGNPVDSGWIIGILLVGVAALHPSITQPLLRAERTEPRIGRVRFAALAGAALVAPAILLVKEVQGGDALVPGLVLEWTILFGLVLVRLATTVDHLAISLHERRRLQSDLAYGASHDPLTRLANRTLFEGRLALAMTQAPATTAVIFLDLDDFKLINDTLGHPTGDEMLRVVASRVASGLRGTDLVARVGGDEFAILVENCADATSARSVAERAVSGLRPPVTIGNNQLLIHASAGVAMSRLGATAVDLMREADIAMYAAKARGKDQVDSYTKGMRGQITRNYELRTELAEALVANQFVVHYQPIVNLGTGMVIGAEALVRWSHPVRGLLPPSEFIPDAEESGLIHPLGKWILREACATAAAWPDRPDGQRPSISVNLAAGQLLQPALVNDVAVILSETGLTARRLILEVTESALIDMNVARAALDRLRALGVRLALDDFGTGYSALSYLAQLPFDIVKIDKSFVAGIGDGGRIDALLEGVLGLCSALELEAIAEGIEEPSQLRTLRELGCRTGQGYLFSRPVPAADIVQRMASRLGGFSRGPVGDKSRAITVGDSENRASPARSVASRRPRPPIGVIVRPAPAAAHIH